jgi:hypothetical protein
VAESILFRGALIRYFDVHQGKEGGDVFTRIHMSADYSYQVRDKMDWEEIPDSITDCKLKGALPATNFILTPADKQFARYELNFDISSVEDFQVASLKDDDGDVCGRQLRFVVRTSKDGVEAFCGQYIRRVGHHAGALKISYTVQEQLDLHAEASGVKKETVEKNEAADDEKFGATNGSCVSCNNRIPFEDKDRLRHSTGAACTRGGDGNATLASARTVGGTHAKGRKQRRQPDDSIPEAAHRRSTSGYTRAADQARSFHRTTSELAEIIA